MVIRETTPLMGKVFTMELNGEELVIVKKALQMFKDDKVEDRMQQFDYAASLPDELHEPSIAVSAEEDLADRLLANINHTL